MCCVFWRWELAKKYVVIFPFFVLRKKKIGKKAIFCDFTFWYFEVTFEKNSEKNQNYAKNMRWDCSVGGNPKVSKIVRKFCDIMRCYANRINCTPLHYLPFNIKAQAHQDIVMVVIFSHDFDDWSGHTMGRPCRELFSKACEELASWASSAMRLLCIAWLPGCPLELDKTESTNTMEHLRCYPPKI